LTEDDITEILRLTNQEGMTSRSIAEMYGVGKSTIGDLLRKETYKNYWEKAEDKPVAGGAINKPSDTRPKLKGSRFVLTSAQNNTFVHDGFLKALEVYCEHNKAELIVGSFIYNKTGFQTGESDETWFDPKIKKYLLNEGAEIAKGLVWCGELNILPTAKTPLTGLQNYTNQDSCIVPHAKLQMQSIPTPIHMDARLMYTTGTVTQRNYRQQKAGQQAEHHHSFSALVVEVDEEGDWFVRQLNCEEKTGNFYDVTNNVEYYTKVGVTDNHGVEAINWGDIHAAKIDKDVAKASWGKGGIIDVIKPRVQFANDLYDQRSRNHHNLKDPYFMYEMHTKGIESVEDEVYLTGNLMLDMMRPDTDYVVVQSNHDMALRTWLKTTDYRHDPVNAEFFLEMQLASYKAIKNNVVGFSILEHALKTKVKGLESVRFLSGTERYRIAGDIECGSHGCAGNNGSRPSTRSFQIQGIKYNIGHQHSANIMDGVYVAGVSGLLNMGYNAEGGSSWSQSHIITMKNGKRMIITLKKGKSKMKWRG
jgi:hypothetical protein